MHGPSTESARERQIAVARDVLADAFDGEFSHAVIDGMLQVSVAQASEVPGLAGDAEFAGFRLAQERLQALSGGLITA